MCEGFCCVDVPPSPKFHDQLVGLPADVSVKFTVSGAPPEVGEPVNEAVGGVPEPTTSNT